MSLVPSLSYCEPFALIRLERMLPRPGEVRVRHGQPVTPRDVVARARVPQNHRIIDVAQQLGVPVERVDRYILKRVGEPIEEGEPIAARRTIAGLHRIMVRSPIHGEVVELEKGLVILEGDPLLVEVQAAVNGTVAEVVQPWGAVVETWGARVRLAWGRGRLMSNELKIPPLGEDGLPEPESLDEMEHRGIIIAVLTPLTEAFLRAAGYTHVEGLIAASMDAGLVPLAEELNLNIGLSEGFGQMPMNDQVARILRDNNGRQITVDPGPPEHWRVSRPEIIISLPGDDAIPPDNLDPDRPLSIGDRVRVLRGPNRGVIGNIVALPERPQPVPSGLWLMGANVKLSGDETDFVPFANLEHLG